MSELASSQRLRAAIGLIAAYAIALQAVFVTLAPMPALANADPFAAHCFGSNTAGTSDSGEPGVPSPASGKMHCVFCGACTGSFVALPMAAVAVHERACAPLAFLPPASIGAPVTGQARDGPARAPPHHV
jgi:hypothetical protein